MSQAVPVPGMDRMVVSDETTLGPVLSVSGTGKMTWTADTVSAVRGRSAFTISTWPGQKKRHIFGWMTRTPAGRVQPLSRL
jgi:hypothetical protein